MTLQTPLPPIAPEHPGAGHDEHLDGYGAVLQNKSFLALWIGQVFSQIADRIIFVVFIALIVKYFGPSDKYNSYLYVAFTIPAILLTAIAGVFVDRWPRKALLVSTNLLRAAIVALLPTLAFGSPNMLFVMAFLISCATQFFVPAEAATIPAIVPKHHLIIANSLFTTTMMASVIFGFALGDPLINIFTLKEVHWAITGLFVLASIALLFIKTPPQTKTEISAEDLRHAFHRFWDEIQDGLQFIREHSMVRNGMLKLAVLFSGVVALCILFISFAKTFLFDDPLVAARKFAYIITYSGIGMALGAFWVGHQFRRTRRAFLVYGGFSVIGIALLTLTAISQIAKTQHVFVISSFDLGFMYLDEVFLTYRMVYTYLLAIIMGVGAAFVAIPLQAMLQELIPEDKRGKVMGVQFTLLSTCSTIPALIAGLAVEYIGVQWMFALFGLPLLLFGLLGLRQRMQMRDVPAANW